MWVPTNGCSAQVKEKFATLSRQMQILWVVFGVHLSLVFILCVHHFFWKEKPKAKIMVRTVQNRSQIQSVTVAKAKTIASGPKKTEPPASVKKRQVDQGINIAVPKKKNSEIPVAKSVAPLTKVMPVSAKSDAPLTKEKPVSTKASEITLPNEIPVARKASEISLPSGISSAPLLEQEDESPSYGQTLVSYLQNCLDLPEYGEVKVDLEIDRLGRLVRFDILEEKSKKNGEFLKKRLPELALPCFNGQSNETVVFTITFKNSTGPLL